MTYTIAQVQQLYLETKDAADAMSKRHAEEMKPLHDRMEVCKSWMLDYLNKTNQNSATTDVANCYKSTAMSVTVDPEGGWDQVLGYILERAIRRVLDKIEAGVDESEASQEFLKEPALNLLNRSVNKTAVKELLDQGAPPPGVKITHVTQLGVRRA